MNKHLPIDFLRSLLAICDTGNFTKAGEQLGRSQSAISLQMKKLEDIAEHSLFDRQGHNFSLTPQGQMLASYARQILALNDQALDELNPQALKGIIRLGIPSEFATSLLPKVLGEFMRNHPQVSLEVSCDLSRQLRQDFAAEKYDVIFALELLNNDDNLAHRELIRVDDLVWVGNTTVDLNSIQEVQLIAAPEGCMYRQQAIHWLSNESIPWRISYTIKEISGIQTAVKEGIGMTVLARSTVPENLHILSSEQQSTLGKIGMQLIMHPKHQNPAVDRLAAYIEKALLQ